MKRKALFIISMSMCLLIGCGQNSSDVVADNSTVVEESSNQVTEPTPTATPTVTVETKKAETNTNGSSDGNTAMPKINSYKTNIDRISVDLTEAIEQSKEANSTLAELVKEHKNNFPENISCGNGNVDIVGYYFGDLIKDGWKCDVDTSLEIESGEMTDFITLDKYGDKVNVKLLNRYDLPISLNSCTVCWCDISVENGNFYIGKSSFINKTYEDTYNHYIEPVEKTDNILHYRLSDISKHLIFDKPFLGMGGGKKPEVIFKNGNESDYYFNFDKGILSSVSIRDEDLIFLGANNNVRAADLGKMDRAKMLEISQLAKDVSTDINNEFAKDGLDLVSNDIISVNPETGEITMRNDVLFGVDESSLTKDGEEYIDQFILSLCNVLLSDKYDKKIIEIAVEGHTDDSGDYDYNLDLSQKRADNVENYFINNNKLTEEQKNKLKSKISSTGYSYKYLVYDTNGNVDKRASRRVNIKILFNTK